MPKKQKINLPSPCLAEKLDLRKREHITPERESKFKAYIENKRPDYKTKIDTLFLIKDYFNGQFFYHDEELR